MYKRSTKIIRVSCETYKNLDKLGTLVDSFDSVIQRLLTSENKRRYPHITMSKQTSNSKLRDTHDTVNTTANDTRKEDTPIREIYCCLTSCSKCIGTYTDSIDGTMLRIICRHECHSLSRSQNIEHKEFTRHENWTGFEE